MQKIPHNDITKLKKAACFFKTYLNNKQYLYICKDNNDHYRFIECVYDFKQFKHLTGIETYSYVDSYQFYCMCVYNNKELYKQQFRYKPLTGQKMHVIVKAVKNLKAPTHIGVLNIKSVNYIDSQYVIGQDNYAIGIKMVNEYNNIKYKSLVGIPNTTLNRDFDCIASEKFDVLAVLSKDERSFQYNDIEILDHSFSIDDIVEYKMYYNRINVNNLNYSMAKDVSEILRSLNFVPKDTKQTNLAIDYPMTYSSQKKIK